MNVFAKKKKNIEILNLLIGFELIIVGVLYFTKGDISSADYRMYQTNYSF